MALEQRFELEVQALGVLPIVGRFVGRLGLEGLLGRWMGRMMCAR
jgi:hypothetical protein